MTQALMQNWVKVCYYCSMRYYKCKNKLPPLLEERVLKTKLNGSARFVDLFARTNTTEGIVRNIVKKRLAYRGLVA